MTTPTVQQLDTALVDIGALTPHPENANRHTTAGAVSDPWTFTASTSNWGARSTGHIVYGNGLYAQLLAKGAPQVLVTWLDLDDDEAAVSSPSITPPGTAAPTAENSSTTCWTASH